MFLGQKPTFSDVRTRATEQGGPNYRSSLDRQDQSQNLESVGNNVIPQIDGAVVKL